MTGTMDLGIANDGERSRCKQTAQIAIALLADAAKHSRHRAPGRPSILNEPSLDP
jgi:hypothetical protein